MYIAQLQPSNACAGPVITCFYHRLVQALRWHWEQWAHEKDSPIKSKGMSEIFIELTLSRERFRTWWASLGVAVFQMLRYPICLCFFSVYHF